MKRLAFVLCLAATGCGGQAMQGVPGGGAKSESELGSTIEASAAEMERELASLEVAKKPSENGADHDQAGAVAGAEEKPAAEAGEPPAAPPPADAEATTTTNEPAEDERDAKRDGCRIACKALASMKRTEARICELVGESHDKCTWAHERVKEAVQRIERAQCSCKD